MRFLDTLLQRWRFRKVAPWIPAGARVLDIGCHQGELFQRLRDRIGKSVGYDPLAVPGDRGGFCLLSERFTAPSSWLAGSFDAVVLAATLEHILDKTALPMEFYRLIRPGGRIIITVPLPLVDRMIDWLRWLGLLDGMSVEEHHGFVPEEALELFSKGGFRLEHRRSFQLGLNHLFVFTKP